MKIVNRLKSENVKKLVVNFSYLSLLQIASYIFPLLTYPYLARVIGVAGFGKIAFASAVIMYFQTVVDWGFNFTATRDIARCRKNIKRVSEIFINVIWAKIYLMLAIFILFSILICFIPLFRENKTVLLFTFLIIPGNIFFAEWLFQGLEKMKYITVLSLVSKSLFTLLVFIVIKERSDFYLQPLLIALGCTISSLCSLYIIIIKWKIPFTRPCNKEVFNTIKMSSDVFINQIVPNLYNGFSILLLGFFWGAVSNGILDAGSKLVNASQQFFRVISRVFFPYLSRNINAHGKFAYYYLLLSVIVSVALFIFAPVLMNIFFTKEFKEGIVVLRLIAISGIFLTMNDIYGTNYLLIIGKEATLRNITIGASLIGFCISFPLVYYYNYLGAALVIAIARGLLGGMSYFCTRRINDIV